MVPPNHFVVEACDAPSAAVDAGAAIPARRTPEAARVVLTVDDVHSVTASS